MAISWHYVWQSPSFKGLLRFARNDVCKSLAMTVYFSLTLGPSSTPLTRMGLMGSISNVIARSAATWQSHGIMSGNHLRSKDCFASLAMTCGRRPANDSFIL